MHRRLFNPLIIFLVVQILWVIVLLVWINWFVGLHRNLKHLAEKYSPELAAGGIDWFILAEGIVLLVAILIGIYLLFLTWRRQQTLYRTQRDLIAQVTHELKSPLASLQLHLETLRRHPPEPGELERFTGRMLKDTERLRHQVDNLLTANRLERRSIPVMRQHTDLSRLVTDFFEGHRDALRKDASLELAISPGLYAEIEVASIETALRNLFENALLYSDGPPRIRVTLERSGGHAHLVVADAGQGIARRDLKRIFRLFHRAPSGERHNRGTGLGLFIVRAVAGRHHGKVWAESAGPGQGAAFHLLLPLASPPRREAP